MSEARAFPPDGWVIRYFDNRTGRVRLVRGVDVDEWEPGGAAVSMLDGFRPSVMRDEYGTRWYARSSRPQDYLCTLECANALDAEDGTREQLDALMAARMAKLPPPDPERMLHPMHPQSAAHKCSG
jgi:hypothetical protein